jgi:hypothetical protein
VSWPLWGAGGTTALSPSVRAPHGRTAAVLGCPGIAAAPLAAQPRRGGRHTGRRDTDHPRPHPEIPPHTRPPCLSWRARRGEIEGKSACLFGTPGITTPGQDRFPGRPGESVRTVPRTLSCTIP